MIDFDELDDLDINVRLREVCGAEGVEARPFLKAVEAVGMRDEVDHFQTADPFERCSKEPRRILRAADVATPQRGGRLSLALLVPFREDKARTRSVQLREFVRHFATCFLPALPPGLEAHVVVVEQSGKGGFNRGKLLNCGARWARAFLHKNVILCLHDVDLLPDPEMAPFYCHYEEGECLHIGWVNRKYDYPHFFGGVCSIPMPDFLASGGFPNDFWGWGREDDVLHARLRVLARTRVLIPAASSGLRSQDRPCDQVAHSHSENCITEQHLLGMDNIFDRPSFTVLDHAERGWLSHLLLDLKPESPAEALAQPGHSMKLVEELLEAADPDDP